jgi:hypothetical protein
MPLETACRRPDPLSTNSLFTTFSFAGQVSFIRVHHDLRSSNVYLLLDIFVLVAIVFIIIIVIIIFVRLILEL